MHSKLAVCFMEMHIVYGENITWMYFFFYGSPMRDHFFVCFDFDNNNFAQLLFLFSSVLKAMWLCVAKTGRFQLRQSLYLSRERSFKQKVSRLVALLSFCSLRIFVWNYACTDFLLLLKIFNSNASIKYFVNFYQLGSKGDVNLQRSADGFLVVPQKLRVGKTNIFNLINSRVQARKTFMKSIG